MHGGGKSCVTPSTRLHTWKISVANIVASLTWIDMTFKYKTEKQMRGATKKLHPFQCPVAGDVGVQVPVSQGGSLPCSLHRCHR